MTVLKDKLTEAIEAKKNDISTYTWKFARKADGTQEEIKLIDATPEQLQKFYNHCMSMLYSKDKLNPGRYILLDIIDEQRRKCNVELFLRKLGTGELSADKKPYPRHLYLLDLGKQLDINKKNFPADQLDKISISALAGKLPREFERISIAEVREGALSRLGNFDNKHITFSFILNLGVCLTPEEMKEIDEKDENGKSRSKLEVIKERLNIKKDVRLTVKSSGLNMAELRAMINLRPKNYCDLTTDQLVLLRNTVLFKLEDEVKYHIGQWEAKLDQIRKVASERGIELVNP